MFCLDKGIKLLVGILTAVPIIVISGKTLWKYIDIKNIRLYFNYVNKLNETLKENLELTLQNESLIHELEFYKNEFSSELYLLDQLNKDDPYIKLNHINDLKYINAF